MRFAQNSGDPELDRQKSMIADIFYYFVVSTHALTGAPFMGGSAVRESSHPDCG
jgi:hypothetical protein